MVPPHRVTKLTIGMIMTFLQLVSSVPAAQAEVFRLEEATIADITAAFDAGALTCRQLTQLYLNRIAAYDKNGPKINSIITVNPRALETAAALDEERRTRGPRSRLHCIPVLLKDNIDTAGMPTTNGSVILKDAIPPDDSFITKALRDAGALILGKASMGEFASGSYNTVIGQTVNPYNLLHTIQAVRAAAPELRSPLISPCWPLAPTRAHRCGARRRSTASSAFDRRPDWSAAMASRPKI